MTKLVLWITLSVGLCVLLFSCKKDRIITDSNAQLEFSVDTLHFDTVFTTLGSATRFFKVYNPHKQPIVINDIMLGEGSGSQFRLNIDGVSTSSATDIQLAPQDSMYIFVEVTIDPNDDNSPYVLSEKVSFLTNGNTQTVLLEAWGQNANYIGSKAGLSLLSCNGGQETFYEALNNPLEDAPIVIYGILVVDTCALLIEAGTQVYIHGALVSTQETGFYNDGRLIFGPEGKLLIQGTKDNPVVLQGDRIEQEQQFQEGTGQWWGIWLSPLSSGHEIEYGEIKNSIIGIYVDSLVDLTIKNSKIHNTSSNNILARHSTINAENCLFYSANQSNLYMLEGGDYNFNYCTIATYGSAYGISHEQPAVTMSNNFCLDNFCTAYRYNDLNANFSNCIITGSRSREIVTSAVDEAAFNYTLDHCLIKVDLSEEADQAIEANCNECVVNEDPLFVSIDEQDYHLDSLSAAAAKALPSPNPTFIPLDIEETSRKTDAPALGAYEYGF